MACNNLNELEFEKPLTAASFAGARRRQYLSETRTLPTQTEVKRELGPKLAEVFFEDLSYEGKIWLGLIPPLIGPDELWIAPGSRLEDKVRLTPIPEPRDILLKAFCHENILEIGEQCLKVIEEKQKREIEEALRLQALKLEEECESKIRDAVHASRDENENYCKGVVGTLMEHFEKCFNELVDSMEKCMLDECDERVKAEKAEVAAEMFAKMQDEINRHEMELRNSFNECIQEELKSLESKYRRQIHSDRNTAIVTLRETIQKYEKLLCKMKTEMEASCLVDICRAINSERQQCSEFVRMLEANTKSRIEELEETIKYLKNRIRDLEAWSKESIHEFEERQINWRSDLRELVNEFQKFINFALKAAPAQAEYLLSLEKLIRNFPKDQYLNSDNKSTKRPVTQRLNDWKLPRLPSRAEPEILPRKPIVPDKVRRFDYCKFKRVALNLSCDEKFIPKSYKTKPKKKKKIICKEKPEKPIDRTSSFYQLLTLVGEHEKSHLVPVEEFIDDRIISLMNIVKRNPELAKVMLGCP